MMTILTILSVPLGTWASLLAWIPTSMVQMILEMGGRSSKRVWLLILTHAISR